MSLGLKLFYFRQCILGSSFCVHSATLCLLTGSFSPLPFKVIIDRDVVIVTLLFVLKYFLFKFWIFFMQIFCINFVSSKYC